MTTGQLARAERLDLTLGPIIILRPADVDETVIQLDTTQPDEIEFHWELMLDLVYALNPRVPVLPLDDPDYEVGPLSFWIIEL